MLLRLIMVVMLFWFSDTQADFIGVKGRMMSAEVSVGSAEQKVSVVQPMGYVSARVGLPFSGLYVGALANAGSEVLDYQIRDGWYFCQPDDTF